jgi:hypothetical protein
LRRTYGATVVRLAELTDRAPRAIVQSRAFSFEVLDRPRDPSRRACIVVDIPTFPPLS